MSGSADAWRKRRLPRADGLHKMPLAHYTVAPDLRIPVRTAPAPRLPASPVRPDTLVGGAGLGGVLLASSGFPGIGYLCLGAAAFSTVIIVRFMRRADADDKILVDEPS